MALRTSIAGVRLVAILARALQRLMTTILPPWMLLAARILAIVSALAIATHLAAILLLALLTRPAVGVLAVPMGSATLVAIGPRVRPVAFVTMWPATT